MASSLSTLVNNIVEGTNEIKCKDCDCFLEYESVKNNLIKYKCLSCDKDYSNKIEDEGYFFEVDVQYPEKLHHLHNGLPFYLKE